MGNIIVLENQTVGNLAEITTDNKLVLVDFMASWCGPCKAISPILETISKEQDILIIKLDVDKNSELASNIGIRGVPTLSLYRDGLFVKSITGMKSKSQILDFIS